MTKNTKLVWRLGKLPSIEELRSLVADKIITNEEAREILFTSEQQEDRDKKSLEGEIKLLRELIDKISNGTSLVQAIRNIPIGHPWLDPYKTWINNTNGQSFLSIKTF